LTSYENVLEILVIPHLILNMFCHSHLCPEYVQGLFGENIITVLTHILNSIFLEGDIPEVLKIGLLSPIFKNKGSKNDAINYRGITVFLHGTYAGTDVDA
jgi:hypothetical protein